MNEKQKSVSNEMLNALNEISIAYTVSKLQKSSRELYRLEYVEVLEMAYENLIETAKRAKKWKKFV